MAYGFGTTKGTTTTDIITNSAQPSNGQCSYFISFAHNAAGSVAGRLYDANSSPNNEILYWDEANSRITLSRTYSGGVGTWSTPIPSSPANWHTFGYTKNFADTNTPVMYLDGLSSTVTTLAAPSGTVMSVTGTYGIGNLQGPLNRVFDGSICRFYKWTTILTASEFARLDSGVDPTTIQPASLVIAMLMSSNATDSKGNTTSVTGALVVTDPIPKLPVGIGAYAWNGITSTIEGAALQVNANIGAYGWFGVNCTVTNHCHYDIVNSTDLLTGQNIRIVVPNSTSPNPYNAAVPTKAVLFIHGSGGNETDLTNLTKSIVPVVNALVDAGYIVANSYAHGDAWGNAQSIDDYAALEHWLRLNYNIKGVAIWSGSMGGLAGLSIAAQGKFPIVGWLGTYPVCNLADVYAGAFTSIINTAYGITGVGIYTYANQTYGYDPALKTAKAYKNIPMRFYASSGDTVVAKAANTDVLQAIVSGSRKEAEIVVCSGEHGDHSHIQPTDYLAFFDRCFSNAVNGEPNFVNSSGLFLEVAPGINIGI